MDFKNFELSEFIRYILTGFNFVLFVVVLPAMYLQPDLLKDILNGSSFFTLALLSVAMGYLLDTLKIYQFTPKFTAKRTEFMNAIAKALDIPTQNAMSYHSLTSKLIKKYGLYDIDRKRAEWVLMLDTGVTFMISSVAWALILASELLQSTASSHTFIPVSAIIVVMICSIRLFRVAAKERNNLNRDFMIVLEKNRALILEGWKLNPSLTEVDNPSDET